jgi:DNA processing protein
MTVARLRIAMAFTKSASSLRIPHSERSIILEKAYGLEGLQNQLLTMKDESPRQNELYRRFLNELSHTDGFLPTTDSDAISIVHRDYPERLLHTDQPPSILFYRGKYISSLNDPFVITVIGTRNPSFYGLEVTKKLCKEMVRRGITIVSGGARGIDGQAHRTAITGGSATVAVLGCGVDVVYPKEHASLFEQIVHRGALVSEYPFGTLPRKHHFPARNRILAGLCDAVLVTEASSFSGTLITAGFAADYGRDVCAVPGSILSGTSRSCHDLIREGAVIIESIDDIPRIPSHPIHGDESIDICCLSPYCNQPEMAQNDVSKEEECILNLLASAPRTLRSISEQCHLDLRKTALSLANLQSKGLVSLYRGLYVRSGVVSG